MCFDVNLGLVWNFYPDAFTIILHYKFNLSIGSKAFYYYLLFCEMIVTAAITRYPSCFQCSPHTSTITPRPLPRVSRYPASPGASTAGGGAPCSAPTRMHQTAVPSAVWQRRTNKIIAAGITIIGLTMMLSLIPQCIYIGVVFVACALM